MKRKFVKELFACFVAMLVFGTAFNAVAYDKIDTYAYDHKMPEGNPVQEKEVWAYLLHDHMDDYEPGMPITDLCVFSADINCYGEISSIPNPRKGKLAQYNGRRHLVLTCDSRSLTHFVLDPSFGIRKKVIAKMGEAVKSYGYDGIQVDFEVVPARDAENFRTFLADIRKEIGEEKWTTVALPARTKTIADDIYDYQKMAPYVDRIIVMAYDEHWSGSKPGSVASFDWCKNIATYCNKVLPQKKIVMGLPFYGRSWENKNFAKAWYFSGINRIMLENGKPEVKRNGTVPYFSFDTTITVTGYFEDTYSIVERLRMYKNMDINRVAFWCLGEEDGTVWNWIKTGN